MAIMVFLKLQQIVGCEFRIPSSEQIRSVDLDFNSSPQIATRNVDTSIIEEVCAEFLQPIFYQRMLATTISFWIK